MQNILKYNMVEEAWLDEGDTVISKLSYEKFLRLIELEKAVKEFFVDLDKGGYNFNARTEKMKKYLR